MYNTMSYIISYLAKHVQHNELYNIISLAKHVQHNELYHIISGKTCTTQ